ncbi:MAG: sterol desaturase family protein [Candidatus Pelagadaptatus aseana]|uniref:sterol desaturase family protein n=1 Tax=Candidatus Pelagadaptatus aseana TaxID=3120508 RepID=UPI0039B32EB8
MMETEQSLRLSIFFGVLLTVALWELIAPKRALTVKKSQRWLSNFAISFLNIALLRLLFPIAAGGAAVLAAEQQWGLFNSLGLPFWLAFVVGFVLLDLLIYWQHRIFHRVPLLWRLHRMHHMDLDIDVSTGIRFHPLEALLSMAIKVLAIVVLGVPVEAVLLFEVVLNATAMFNHGNIALPHAVDRWLRLVMVTPDMHRVHHSVIATETHSNFGFNLPWWDRLFGSYRAQPRDGHDKMTIGLARYRSPNQSSKLGAMLLHPFRKESNR